MHFIAHFRVDDPIGYGRYEQGFFPILRAFGGRFITYDDRPTVLGGTRSEGRTVILGFDSESACLEWWNSPEYRELAQHREASTTSFSVVIVHSPPPR